MVRSEQRGELHTTFLCGVSEQHGPSWQRAKLTTPVPVPGGILSSEKLKLFSVCSILLSLFFSKSNASSLCQSPLLPLSLAALLLGVLNPPSVLVLLFLLSELPLDKSLCLSWEEGCSKPFQLNKGMSIRGGKRGKFA